MNKTFYLFRHALATRSKRGYGDKILTAEILPEETGPVRKMAAYFKDNISGSANFRSELLRCRQTAEIITGITGFSFSADSRLNEYYLDPFQKFSLKIRNWLDFTTSIRSENILVCTHGSVIAGIENYILKGRFPKSHLYDYPECGELVILQGQDKKLIDFNN